MSARRVMWAAARGTAFLISDEHSLGQKGDDLPA